MNVRKEGRYLPFKDARDFVRGLKLENQIEWMKYAHSNKRPLNIPCDPRKFYSDNGWVGMGDWLGTFKTSCFERKYKVNDDYFSRWSRNMAYILGFWWADGCICIKGHHYYFEIDQHIKDKYILDQILSEMGSDRKVYEHGHRNTCMLKITSRKIVSDIVRLGGKERKSLDIKFPRVPKKYLPDFVRGLWDGDGSITYHKHDKSYRSSFVSGSKDMIYALHGILKDNVSNLGGSVSGHKTINMCYQLCFGKKDTIRLKNFLYAGVDDKTLKLNRKYDIFKMVGVCYDFLDYESAKAYVRGLGISTMREWKRFSKDKRTPIIPSHPEYTYRNDGWAGWRDWWGLSEQKWMPFEEAREFVRKQNIVTQGQWSKWAKTPLRPKNIPAGPYQTYMGQGWISWRDWLGERKNA